MPPATASPGTRVGVIGGSFDPIHVGHLSIAREVRERLALSRMAFVPAGQPPHKLDKRLTDAGHRLEMVRLAIDGDPTFELSRVDVDRSGPGYSVDTVRLLQKAWGEGTRIYFTIGADSLADLPTWYHPEELLRLCQVVAVGRPGYPVDLEAVERLFPDAPPILYLALERPVDVSSTDIRRRVAEGRSIRGMVPEAVEQYIHRHGLYRD